MFPVGRKQPRNQHQNPVRPYIPEALPRFVDSGKKWSVDVGAVMKEKKEQYIGTPVISRRDDGTTGSNLANTRGGVYMPDMHSGAVLSVSRNNQASYGRRSHYGVWDGTMRLATINPYHKLKSLNRIPAKALKSTRAPMPAPFNPTTTGIGVASDGSPVRESFVPHTGDPQRYSGYLDTSVSNTSGKVEGVRYTRLGGEPAGGKTYTPFSGTANGASGGFKARNNTLFGLEKKLLNTPDTYPSTTNIPQIIEL